MGIESQVDQKLKSTLSYSKGHQIFIYLISALVAPFGLGWAFKYFKSGTREGKRVGIIIVVITAISLLSVIAIYLKLANTYNKILNFDPQLYQDLGL